MSSITCRIHQLLTKKNCSKLTFYRQRYSITTRSNNNNINNTSGATTTTACVSIINNNNRQSTRIRQRQQPKDDVVLRQQQSNNNNNNNNNEWSSLVLPTSLVSDLTTLRRKLNGTSSIYSNPLLVQNESFGYDTSISNNQQYRVYTSDAYGTELQYDRSRRLYSTTTIIPNNNNSPSNNDITFANSETVTPIPLHHEVDNNNHPTVVSSLSLESSSTITNPISVDEYPTDTIDDSSNTILANHNTKLNNNNKKSLSIYEMDASSFHRGYYTITELEEFVRQVENMDQLTADDIGPLLLPLTRKIAQQGTTRRNNNNDPNNNNNNILLQAAILMERIVFACLARLPPEYYTGTDEEQIETALRNRCDLPYPPSALYNRCIIVWGNIKDKQSAQRADKIFHLMLDEYNREYNFLYHPNIQAYIIKRHKQQQQVATTRSFDNENVLSSSSSSSPIISNNHSPVRVPISNNYNDNDDDAEIDSIISSLNRSKDGSDKSSSVIASNSRIYEIQSALPNRKTYKSLIRSWATANDGQEPVRAYNYLKQMEQYSGVYNLLDDYDQYLSENDPQSPINNNTQQKVQKNNKANKTTTTINGNEAEKSPIENILMRTLEMPDRATYNTVISAYSKSHVLRHPHALRRCNEIIYRMDRIKNALMDVALLPDAASEYELDAYTYHAWLRAYSRYINYAQLSQNHKNAGWAKYTNIVNSDSSSTTTTPPNPHHVETTCFLHPSYVSELTSIIQRMHQQQKQYERQKVEPSHPLHYWSSNNDDTDNNNDDNDVTIQNRQITTNVPQVFPNLYIYWVYGVLIEALVRTSPLIETIQIADNILLSMVGKGPNPIQPDFNFINVMDQHQPIHNIKRTYNNNSAKGNNNNNTTNTNNHDNSNEYEYGVGEGQSNIERNWPRSDSVLLVLRGWERTGIPKADEKIEALLKATVLGENAPPYPRIYFLHKDMQLWENSGWKYAPELCEMMLLQSLEYYRNGRTDVQNMPMKDRIKPTGQTFAIAMRVWMKARRPDAPHRMEIILQKMISLYENEIRVEDQQYYHRSKRYNDSYWFRPREVHFRYLLTAWIQECDTGKTYKGITGNKLYPAEHCENLLSLWVYDTNIVDENISGIYSLAIRAWDKQVLPETVEEDNVDNDVRKSNIPNPVERARILFNQLSTMYNKIRHNKPNSAPRKLPSYPCNSVLEVCTRPQPTVERQSEAYQTAADAFRRSLRNGRSYVLMAHVIQVQILQSSLLEESTNGDGNTSSIHESYKDIIVELFQECCQAGMLTQEMIWHVVDVAPSETLTELFGVPNQSAELITQTVCDPKQREQLVQSPPHHLLVNNLPRSWSVNANRQRGTKQSPSSSKSETLSSDEYDY